MLAPSPCRSLVSRVAVSRVARTHSYLGDTKPLLLIRAFSGGAPHFDPSQRRTTLHSGVHRCR